MVGSLSVLASTGVAQVERVWLSYLTPDQLVLSCQTVQPGTIEVRADPGDGSGTRTFRSSRSERLHQIEIPVSASRGPLRYEVRAAQGEPVRGTLPQPPRETLRIAVVADWAYAGVVDLAALLRDDPHLLVTAGDNVAEHHSRCGEGVQDCTKAYEALIDSQPELFRSVPFLPILGNHDHQIRPRGSRPPEEPVYDVAATAFRRFFALPEPEWRWELEFPRFGLRLLALDLHHITDFGTTWQTGHAFDPASEQQRWFDASTSRPGARFVVALQNEQNARMRGQPGWAALFGRCTAVVTGYGYYAERAEPPGGVPFFNTCLAPPGDAYRDPACRFFARERGYLLLTFSADGGPMIVEIKSITGAVLDRSEWPSR